MPLIQVYHRTGALDPEQRTALAERLTHVIIEIEGGPGMDRPTARSIAWVMFHDVEPSAWFIGGASDDTYVSPPGEFLVRVYVPEGSLSKARKAMVHKAVDEAFYDVFKLGTPPEKRWPSLFVHIHEWGEGNLGAFGRSHGLADVGAYVGEGNPEIRARSRKYLGAHRAWREAAGFPE
jgi:phenylpyruvate tautomerase PptA (4-oxalocrotonate tautomerase family)